jgi:hypothetical protein
VFAAAHMPAKLDRLSEGLRLVASKTGSRAQEAAD